MVTIRNGTADDVGWVRALLVRGWGGPVQVMGERAYRPAELPTLIADDDGDRVGVLSYTIDDDVAWIVLLEAVRPREGVGGMLVRALLDRAQRAGCRAARVVTTNDNHGAQAFYVAEGFALADVRAGAVTRARRRKPSIPLTGVDGTPITDELEYVRHLL
jgi:ribosomal protein S18 acetylase RimI-like enzyme